MDFDSSTKFISSLAKFLQSLCNGYVEFDNGVQVIGHLYLSVDTGKTIDYVLNEKVSKTDENSVTFISNSFHAQPAEKPKPEEKKNLKPDTKCDEQDDNVEQLEPSSTNYGTVQGVKGTDHNSPHGHSGKRPHSPLQRQGKDVSGRMSPKHKKSRMESLELGHSQSHNENGFSSAPCPADDNFPVSSESPQDSSFSESYPQTFFPPMDEEHSTEGSDRDVKPSLDTDVTFIKEEYAPSNQGGDKNQAEDSSMYQSMFPSHSYPSGAYAGHGNFGPPISGSQKSNLGSPNDKTSMYASGQSLSQFETTENSSDPSESKRRMDGAYIPNLPEKLLKTGHKWKDRPRNFQCEFCEKAFVVRRDWIGHMNAAHLNKRPYKCQFCQADFSNYKPWKTHSKICSWGRQHY